MHQAAMFELNVMCAGCLLHYKTVLYLGVNLCCLPWNFFTVKSENQTPVNLSAKIFQIVFLPRFFTHSAIITADGKQAQVTAFEKHSLIYTVRFDLYKTFRLLPYDGIYSILSFSFTFHQHLLKLHSPGHD